MVHSIMLIMLYISSYLDIKKKMVYLPVIWFCTIAALIILQKEHAFINIYGMIFVFFIAYIISFVTQKALGTGDIWILSVVTINAGVTDLLRLFGITFLLVWIVALALLIFCQADRYHKIPLVPFVFAGYIWMLGN